MNYIAMLIGFVVLVLLCMANINVMLSAFAAAFTVTILAGLPVTESLVDVFFGRFGEITGSLFPMFLFGAVLAKLYTLSGAASGIADSICLFLFKKTDNNNTKYTLGFLSVIIASAVLCYGGINAAVALLAIYPIALNIFRRADIPKRFIMGAICGGAFTFALSGPGSPQPTNVVGMVIGTGPYCGLIAGIAASIIEVVVMLLIFTRMCIKASQAGEHFEPGPRDVFADDNKKKPPLILSLMPILILLMVFNIFGVNISLSILITTVFAAMIFFPGMGKEGIFRSMNEGAKGALLPVGAIAAVNGFAAVIQSMPEYQKLIDMILSAKVPPVMLLIGCVAFICMITGGSTTGAQIALPAIAPALTQLGLSLPFIHRVGVFAATMLDSLPNSGSVIMAVGLADLKMKEGYPPVFVSTVVATTCGTLTAALVMTLFPALP